MLHMAEVFINQEYNTERYPDETLISLCPFAPSKTSKRSCSAATADELMMHYKHSAWISVTPEMRFCVRVG